MFLLSSRQPQPESNNIRDVAFGLYCLEHAGILKKDIFLLIDCTPPDHVKSIIKEFSDQSYDIHHSSELTEIIRTNLDYKHMVLFVLGHGSQEGIASSPKDITPHSLFSSVKESSSLETATIYLGQCYAGLFNHMNALACVKEDGNKSPSIIVLGATGLYASISSSITEKIKESNVRWSANIFLYYVFLWFKNPLDKDGDLHFTIIDSFKYAGLMTNSRNCGLRVENFVDKLRQTQKITKKISFWKGQYDRVFKVLVNIEANLKKAYQKTVTKKDKRARINKLKTLKRIKRLKAFYYRLGADADYNLKLAKRDREDMLEIFLFNSQEAWVLHSLLAQEVEFPPS